MSYWATNFWAADYWAAGFWVGGDATTITVSVTNGESLASLSYVVFSVSDIGVATIIKQANDESTDGSGNLVIDLTGDGIAIGTVLTIAINNYTATPTVLSKGAVCFGTAA